MLSKTLQLGAAGNAGGEKVYVDDVFSTFAYEGTSATRSINNGIDLDGEGGLTWIKARDQVKSHIFTDTERGVNKYIRSDSSDAENTNSSFVTAFNSNGFSLGDGTSVNGNFVNPKDYVSWTFRKAKGFFDVVTYTGDGTSGRTVSHNLGSVPGCIMIKRLDVGFNWIVYHRRLHISAPEDYYILLNSDGTRVYDQYSTAWNSTAPTATEFTLGTYSQVNTNGGTYVAYIFAHDDQSFGTDGDEAIIECGNYIGTGTVPNSISLGFEPQWLMIKRTDGGSQHWRIFDTARGINTNLSDRILFANQSTDEQNADDYLNVTPNGFTLTETNSTVNGSNDNYIYVAIRRPHKPPEAGTDVFQSLHVSGGTAMSVGFPADMAISGFRDGGSSVAQINENRLLPKYLVTSANSSAGGSLYHWDQQNSLTLHGTGGNFINWVFRRAPGFFDVVAWEGTSTSGSSTDALNHGLGATPELIIVKKHSHAGNWTVYSSVTGINKELELNVNAAVASVTNMIKAAPTDTTFTVGYGLNQDERYYIGYFFSSLDGVSKIGSYSGTGNNLSVNCGFAAGARFVLIKRTDSTGDWWAFDTTRGIVSSGNDPALRLNLTNAEVTNTNYLEPNSNGFTVTSTAGAGLNANGGTYLYLAIA